MVSKDKITDFKQVVLNDAYEKIAIFPHNFPDGDTLGSSIGIAEWLKYYQKKGYIVLDDNIPSNLCFLFEEIEKPLTVSEASRQNWDLIIAVDCGETKLFSDRMALFSSAAMTLAIDHHKTHIPYAKWIYVDETCSSTGEMVGRLFVENQVPLTSVAAQAIYAAIVTDTGSFRYSNTTPSTFEICEKLTQIPFDFNRLNVELFQNKALEKVKLLNDVFATMELYYHNKLAVVTLTQEMKSTLGYSDYDTDGIVEFVRDIEGVEVVAFIKYIDGGEHKISMRSKHHVDVSDVAQRFNGGGHVKAAGYKSKASLKELKESLIHAFKEAF